MSHYSDTVTRLKSQWDDLVASGRFIGFEILDPTLNHCKVYHTFSIGFYKAENNLWYFAAYDDYGRKLFGLSVDYCFDDLDHYFEILYNRCFLECTK